MGNRLRRDGRIITVSEIRVLRLVVTFGQFTFLFTCRDDKLFPSVERKDN